MSKYVGFKIGKVHEEHIESEYYCGGCGWPVTDHDSYCPECGGAFQESFADDALEAENAKLRELVRIAGTYCVNGLCGKDDGCPLYLGRPYCALHDRMRELGVEVER